MERAITRFKEFTKEIADDKFIDCGVSDMKKNVGVSTNLQHEITCVLQRQGYSLEEFSLHTGSVPNGSPFGTFFLLDLRKNSPGGVVAGLLAIKEVFLS
jgi:hypothetical protein